MARYSTAGVLFQININGSFTNIDGIESINGPTGDKPEIDATALNDTAATVLAGLPDYGELSGTVFDNPSDAGNARLLTRFNQSNVTDNFKIILPFSGTGNNLAFDGYVKGWALALEKASAGKYNFTIRCSGNVNRT